MIKNRQIERYNSLEEKEYTGYCSVCGYRKRNLNGYGVCKHCRSKKGY